MQGTLVHLSLAVILQPTRSALNLEVLPGDEFQDDQESEFSAVSLWRYQIRRARGWSRFHEKIPKFYIPYGFYRKFFSLCQKNFASMFAKTEF